ncbi:MAG: coenzyme F420-0:L-glutamate ligase [bacterium]|nr:coenzyme F420-0:L-glutamate ligase [bacterium]
MEVIPITTPRVEINPKGQLSDWISQHLGARNLNLQEGDILVVTSKLVSYFEQRVVDLSTVQVSDQAKKYAEKNGHPAPIMQLVIDEADQILAETTLVLLTKKNKIYCPNAGVDTSNVLKGYAVLWPEQPFQFAQDLRHAFMKAFALKKIAVIISDSMCVPGRSGTTAVAIGYAGISGFQNLKGAKDLFGNTLRYSALNLVDSAATAANLVMGEAAESTPLAIVRNLSWEAQSQTKNDEMIITPSDELYPLE